MASAFTRIEASENLHDRVTRTLGLRVIQAERLGKSIAFPNEAELCQQLGVSRSILREAVKVLEDKGLVEVRPRSGTRSRPRAEWHLLDPDILCWQAQAAPDGRFLRELCEVRLAIEPTASGFAALRATAEETEAIAGCLERREALLRATTEETAAFAGYVERREALGEKAADEIVELNLQFYEAVVAASHNPMFRQLNASIRLPMRVALSQTLRLRASRALEMTAHRKLYEAILGRDPLAARVTAEEIVGFAMLAVEEVIRRTNL